jgi:hypothetical protein
MTTELGSFGWIWCSFQGGWFLKIWNHEPAKPWNCESVKIWNHVPVKPWSRKSMKIWNHEPAKPWSRESVKIRSHEPAKLWSHEPAKLRNRESTKFENLLKSKFGGYGVWRFPWIRDSWISKKPSQRRYLKSLGLMCELWQACKCMELAPQITRCKRHSCTCSH